MMRRVCRSVSALTLGAVVLCLLQAPASAKPAHKITPTIHASRQTVLQQDPVVLSGRTPDKAARLYRRTAQGPWHPVRRIAATRGSYDVTVKPAAGVTTRYRVGVNGPVAAVSSKSCAPLPHYAGVQMWPNDMTAVQTLPIRWTQLICSAASHSTIRFSAMWMFDDDAVMGRMVAAMRNVHELRGVHIDLLVRKSSYTTDAIYGAPSWGRFTHTFGSFATIYSCLYSCTSDAPNAHMHVKAITVSKTIFGQTAAAETGSNFSHKQLADQRESAVYAYDDPQLTRALTTNWNAMLAHQLVDLPIWSPAGTGMTIAFDPHTTVDDPVANELTGLACAPGDTIDVVNATVQRATVLRQLNRLATDGCTVRVIYETTTPKTIAGVTLRSLRLHDKFVVIHAHDADDSAVDEVICGSEDLFPGSLTLSNQQLLRIQLPTIVGAYDSWFSRLWGEAA